MIKFHFDTRPICRSCHSPHGHEPSVGHECYTCAGRPELNHPAHEISLAEYKHLAPKSDPLLSGTRLALHTWIVWVGSCPREVFEALIAPAADAYVPPLGTHDGEIGERIERELTCESVLELEPGDYGRRFLVKFKGDYVWFTGENCWAEEGQTYKLRATVKDHNEFGGRKQTVLTRCMRVKE